MRTPPNDAASDPERRCIISGESGPRAGLIRLAIGPDGSVAPDVRARAPGRGAWIGATRAELEVALSKGKLKGKMARAFKDATLSIPDDLADRIENALARSTLDRLGLEARASTIATGSDRIGEAARKGKVFLLLHAADASDDGCGKLDQAWRVGSDAEGSGKTGLRLMVDRGRISQALGRENTVHVAVTDRGAAQRISRDLDRWHHFVGRATSVDLAEISAKVHGDAARDAEQTDVNSKDANQEDWAQDDE
jgi:uncharacterized protein